MQQQQIALQQQQQQKEIQPHCSPEIAQSNLYDYNSM